MGWLRSTLREIAGLFVDDGIYALSILIWIAVALAFFVRLTPPAPWHGPALFAGLALILIESTLRYSRRR